jgi:integrase/recombinase XerD
MTATVASAPQRHLTELTLEFLATLELERGLSRNTLEAYRSDLQQYGAFLGRAGTDPLDVRPVDLLEFISELAAGRDGKAPVGASTLQRKIACLRSFYRHLRREQIIDHDPTAELRPPRSPERLPKVLSRDEVNRLLAQPRGTSPAALRDRALLETMYACGLRASEAVSLELPTSISRRESCARGARAPKSGSCRSAVRRSRRSWHTSTRVGRGSSVCMTSLVCSSTSGAPD